MTRLQQRYSAFSFRCFRGLKFSVLSAAVMFSLLNAAWKDELNCIRAYCDGELNWQYCVVIVVAARSVSVVHLHRRANYANSLIVSRMHVIEGRLWPQLWPLAYVYFCDIECAACCLWDMWSLISVALTQKEVAVRILFRNARIQRDFIKLIRDAAEGCDGKNEQYTTMTKTFMVQGQSKVRRWNWVDWPVAGDLTNGGGTSYFTAAAAAGSGLSAAEAPWTPTLHLPVDTSGVGLTSLGFDPSAAAGTALFQPPTHQTQLVAQHFAFRVSSWLYW